MCLSVAIARPENVLGTGEHEGFQWSIVHNGIGNRCGYVRIPISHPWHGKGYHDVPAQCHGRLTFAEEGVPCDAKGDDDAWWIGFHCAHGGDSADLELCRESAYTPLVGYGEVRTQEYVESECRSICEQAKEAEVK